MTPEQKLLSGVAKTVFRLNGQLLSVGEELARPGLTAARWPVIAEVLGKPPAVAAIAREIGVTRQSVQQVADLLMQQGLARYAPNPAHRRAKLLRRTDQGYEAVRLVGPAHAAFAARLIHELGTEEARRTLETLTRLSGVLRTQESTPPGRW